MTGLPELPPEVDDAAPGQQHVCNAHKVKAPYNVESAG
jgi:hypothetical protein